MQSKTRVFETEAELRSAVRDWRRQGARIGFVPTMGYLHAGHLSLVNIVKAHCDVVIASIFVNPTQFNNPQDLEKYPRDLPRDLALLESVETTALFLPSAELMYRPDFQTWVELSEISKLHEGEFRPGHFRGVSTIVSMLFNLVQPDVAIFGEKDFQQLRLIEQMVVDMKFPIQIIRGLTMREPDGLAMSSRNVRLSTDSRIAARAISRGLFSAESAFKAGERQASMLIDIVQTELLNGIGISVEYVALVDEDKLMPVETVDKKCRILVAVQVNGVRLIDNLGL